MMNMSKNLGSAIITIAGISIVILVLLFTATIVIFNAVKVFL